ncbi:hypothetical protein HMN09_00731700 [Mycena chlorophos]|uniref:Uncharacterized protein n=1 Tax=Mycena chlorophos TaxID=658473 RepID=A0A8H6STD3_MYCCL|nr:hypothetical protein HMN09_00731700 [Mycena chlorophos]
MSTDLERKKGLGDLPFDIERDIFELTARAFPGFAPQLALVCKYVQAWVEAVMYETVVLGAARPWTHQKSLLDTLALRPPTFFGRTIQHLHLSTGSSDAYAQLLLLGACTNLTSLTCWSTTLHPPELHSILAQSPFLRRLSVDAALLGSIADPLFAKLQLTHLEIVNPPVNADWSMLLALPRLTHLAFGELSAAHEGMPEFFGAALASTSPRLEMLIAISRSEAFLRCVEDLDDERFWMLESYHAPLPPTKYWEGVLRGDIDFWSKRRRDWVPRLVECFVYLETIGPGRF